MGSQYKKILVLGATPAERFINEGSYVIAVGRRRQRIEKLVHKQGHDKVSAVPFDTTSLPANIKTFATNVINTHDDLDCILLKSGIQRIVDFCKPDSVDMDVINQEFQKIYLSQLAVTKAILPFLRPKRQSRQ